MSTIARLERRVASLGSGIVAFSGGVDSSLVAAIAARALGQNALAITAVSPSLALGELDGAREVAHAIGIAHEVVTTDEIARPGYRQNGPQRCYHCKTELYERLAAVARERGYCALLSGANADDAGDWRPGLRAADEHAVVSPLLEAGIGKQQVRELARAWAIPSADKPASPCLASRVPYGTPVDPETLAQIDRAEQAVKTLGYRILRVRHFGDRAKLELGSEDLPRALAPDARATVVAAVRAAGYADVQLSPFRSGSLNAALRVRRSSRVEP